jgi:hypothetical protein
MHPCQISELTAISSWCRIAREHTAGFHSLAIYSLWKGAPVAWFGCRQRELQKLDSLCRETTQFVLVRSHRRAGKPNCFCTGLTRPGTRSSTGWLEGQTVEATRRILDRAFWQWACPERPEPLLFADWGLLFAQMVQMTGDPPSIPILEKSSCAVESDSSLPFHLQATWEHQSKSGPVFSSCWRGRTPER